MTVLTIIFYTVVYGALSLLAVYELHRWHNNTRWSRLRHQFNAKLRWMDWERAWTPDRRGQR